MCICVVNNFNIDILKRYARNLQAVMFSVPGMLSSFSTVQDKHIDKTSSDKNIQI